MPLGIRNVWRLLRATVSEWQLKQVSLLASSLAYYTVFSLAPLLVIVIGIVGAIYGEAATQGRIVEQVQGFFGEEGARVIETAIANLRDPSSDRGPLGFLFNLGFLIFGSSNVFIQIQRALNRVWDVEPEPGRNLIHFVRKRLLSFAMVLVIAFLLLVSFVISTLLSSLVETLSSAIPGTEQLWQFLNFLISFGVITLLFALIYAFLPDVKVSLRDTAVGAIITALLFVIGQQLFSAFLSQVSLGSAYGVAGSFVIIITWIYYSAHILLFGAEFTQVYARRHGAGLIPSKHAVRIPRASNRPSRNARPQGDEDRDSSS